MKIKKIHQINLKTKMTKLKEVNKIQNNLIISIKSG